MVPAVAFPTHLLGSEGFPGLRRDRTPGGIDQIRYKPDESRSHTRGSKTSPPSYQEANNASKSQA